MKVIGLDGRQHTFPPTGHVPDLDELRKRSAPHLKARAFIKSLYGTMRLLEEVQIPGALLYLDFYLPAKKIAFEVQGRQHTQFVQHFHGTQEGFIASQSRDRRKREWCEENNIRLIELPDKENEDEWYDRIMGGTEEE